jgi:hypothetical protein
VIRLLRAWMAEFRRRRRFALARAESRAAALPFWQENFERAILASRAPFFCALPARSTADGSARVDAAGNGSGRGFSFRRPVPDPLGVTGCAHEFGPCADPRYRGPQAKGESWVDL